MREKDIFADFLRRVYLYMEVQVHVLDGILAACLVVVATAASVIAAPMQQHAMRRIRFRRMPVLKGNELGLWHRASAESVHEVPI